MKIETFPNPSINSNYRIVLRYKEFTNLCPINSQPDFAKIKILYVPDEKCIELKSFKQYLHSYRDTLIFHEEIANKILEDLVIACDPKKVFIRMKFNKRGGIKPMIEVNYEK